jgi:hypothetical protein
MTPLPSSPVQTEGTTMNDNAVEERVKLFAEGALAALTDERRAECELLAVLEPGMRLRPSEMYPDQVELVWAGLLVGVTTWSWLNTGEAPPSVSPTEYDEQ